MTAEQEMALAKIWRELFIRDAQKWVATEITEADWDSVLEHGWWSERPPVDAYIPDLEAKIQRMRDEDRGRPVVAAIDAIHAGRKNKPTEWPEGKW